MLCHVKQRHNVLCHFQRTALCLMSRKTASQCVVPLSNDGTLCCVTYKERHNVLCHLQTAALCVVSRKTAAQCVVSLSKDGTLSYVT